MECFICSDRIQGDPAFIERHINQCEFRLNSLILCLLLRDDVAVEPKAFLMGAVPTQVLINNRPVSAVAGPVRLEMSRRDTNPLHRTGPHSPARSILALTSLFFKLSNRH